MKNIVLVTGGSGFLGQHVIKELQEAKDFDEIRVSDLHPYENKTGHTESCPVSCFIGNICSVDDVTPALLGVSTVIHTASCISVSTFPDITTMTNVNVTGTRNIIEGCIKQSVPYLVYTSTMDVVIGASDIDILDGDESIAKPKNLLFKGYAETKCKAENLIIEANGQKLARGGGHTLHTLALRPPTLFGELDRLYIHTVLKSAKKMLGTLCRIGDGSAKMQHMYVGNTAWAHVCAIRALKNKGEDVTGRAYFVNDDTPVQNFFIFAKPFLESCGFKLSSFSIPYPVIYFLFFILHWFLILISPLVKINFDPSLDSIVFTNHSVYFNRSLAEKRLGYRPKYDYKTSLENSISYYSKLAI